MEGVPRAAVDMSAGVDGLDTGAGVVTGLEVGVGPGADGGVADEAPADAGCGAGGVVGSATFFSALRKGALVGS